MSTSTNPVSGVSQGVNAAAAKLLEPQEETIVTDELEQESVEEETLEPVDETVEATAEEVIEDEETISEEVDEDEEEEPAGQDQEGEEEPMYTVKVNGEEYEVNLDELKKGYQLETDYRKKTAATAEERKAIAEKTAALEDERQKYIQMSVAIAQQQKEKLAGLDAEMAELKDVDPVGYMQKKIERDEAEAEINSSLQLAQRAFTEQQAVSQERMTEHVMEQDAILKQQISGWDNPEESVALKKGITEFAKTMGYTDQELANVVNAKDLIVLNKARLYDEMIAKKSVIKKKKAAAKATPRLKASGQPSKTTRKGKTVKAAKEKLGRSGKVGMHKVPSSK